MKDIRSIGKVIGTIVTFGGALLMAIYKGPGFNLFHSGSTTQHEDGSSHNNHQTAGALYILMGCVALSSFYILQVIKPNLQYICFSGEKIINVALNYHEDHLAQSSEGLTIYCDNAIMFTRFLILYNYLNLLYMCE